MDIVTISMIVLVVVSCGGFVWAIVESERYLNRRERELKGEKDDKRKEKERLKGLMREIQAEERGRG